jgi:hypothetical protein
MFGDKKMLWILEYAIGFILLAVVIPFIVHPQPGWSAAHGWAYLLFIACSSITLISSASGTRQRMKLAKRIAELERIVDNRKPAQKQAQSESGQKRAASEHFVGSVN